MYRTAYVELNGTHEILSLSKTADEKVFTYKNVDFFPHAVMSTLTEILNMRSERVIIDSESVKILFNLVEKKKTINHKHFKYPVVGFPYLEDPFLINTSLFGTLDKISERN